MTQEKKDLFADIPAEIPKELFTEILTANNVRIERIVSGGQVTPAGEWYFQAWTEWVLVVEGAATLVFAGNRTVDLKAGEHLVIPPNTKHRVARTAQRTVWLAVHMYDAK